MKKDKAWNIRPDRDMDKWVRSLTPSRGNISIVVRAAVWYLKKQRSPEKIIKDYLKDRIEKFEVRDIVIEADDRSTKKKGKSIKY